MIIVTLSVQDSKTIKSSLIDKNFRCICTQQTKNMIDEEDNWKYEAGAMVRGVSFIRLVLIRMLYRQHLFKKTEPMLSI